MMNEKWNVLFLDIDGVINSSRTACAYNHIPSDTRNKDGYVDLTGFDMTAINLLRNLCKEYNVNIVLSSIWRLKGIYPNLANDLQLPIIDKTADSTPLQWIHDFIELSQKEHGLDIYHYVAMYPVNFRGYQIQYWLEENKYKYSKYAILDDSADMLPIHLPYFVKVDGDEGFSFKNYMDLVNIFTS